MRCVPVTILHWNLRLNIVCISIFSSSLSLITGVGVGVCLLLSLLGLPVTNLVMKTILPVDPLGFWLGRREVVQDVRLVLPQHEERPDRHLNLVRGPVTTLGIQSL